MTEKFTKDFFSDPNEKKEDNTWKSRTIYGPNLPPTLDVECEPSTIKIKYIDKVESIEETQTIIINSINSINAQICAINARLMALES